jgi:alpha-1,3-rhamnosyltransferase
MEKILVSIIIPSYNHEKYIAESVQSVWNQTCKDIELIVIDDGSNDSSSLILNELKKISPIRMMVILKKNEGICKTLNMGVMLSSGKYISILASDDRYLPNKIELLLPLIEKTDDTYSFIYSKNLNISEDGSLNNKNKSIIKNNKNEKLFENILMFKYFPTIASTLIKKKILLEAGGFNEKYNFEDYDILLKLTRRHEALYVDVETFEYRDIISGSLSKNTKLLMNDMINIFEENQIYLNNSIRKYAYACLYARIAESFYMVNDFKQAKYWMLKSIFKYPFIFKQYRVIIPSLLGVKIIKAIRLYKSKH